MQNNKLNEGSRAPNACVKKGHELRVDRNVSFHGTEE